MTHIQQLRFSNRPVNPHIIVMQVARGILYQTSLSWIVAEINATIHGVWRGGGGGGMGEEVFGTGEGGGGFSHLVGKLAQLASFVFALSPYTYLAPHTPHHLSLLQLMYPSSPARFSPFLFFLQCSCTATTCP